MSSISKSPCASHLPVLSPSILIWSLSISRSTTMETITYHPATVIFDFPRNEVSRHPHSHQDVFSQAFFEHSYYHEQPPNNIPQYIHRPQEEGRHFPAQQPSPPISTENKIVAADPRDFAKSFTYNNIQLENLDYSQQSRSFDPNNAYHTANRLIQEVEGGLEPQKWPQMYPSISEEQRASYANNSRPIPQHQMNEQQYHVEYSPPSRGMGCDRTLAPRFSNTYSMLAIRNEPSALSSSESDLSPTTGMSPSSMPSPTPPAKSPKPQQKSRKQRTRSEAEKILQHKAFLARNRKAASNCRMRKKDMEERLSQVCSVQRERNGVLTKEYDELVLEVQKLRSLVEACVGEEH